MIDENFDCCDECGCTHGGLSPVKATADMIQPVGQRNGQLYTKPGTSVYTAGTGIDIDADNVISVDDDELQTKLTAGDNINIIDDVISAVDTTYSAGTGITIDDDNEIAVDTSVIQGKLTAGSNVNISGNTINATDTTYGAGNGIQIYAGVVSAKAGSGINIDASGIKVDESVIQHKLTAGTNITISGNTISATGSTGVTSVGGKSGVIGVGSGIEMTGSNITVHTNDGLKVDADGGISVDTDEIQEKITAGTGITITGNTVAVDTSAIQAKLTAGSNIVISGINQISAVDTTYSAGSGITIDGGNEIAVDESVIQHKLTAGSNITISGNTISATGGSVSATPPIAISGNVIGINLQQEFNTTGNSLGLNVGTGLEIDNSEVVVDFDTVQHKLTAGSNITISGNTISATGSGSPKYVHNIIVKYDDGDHLTHAHFILINVQSGAYSTASGIANALVNSTVLVSRGKFWSTQEETDYDINYVTCSDPFEINFILDSDTQPTGAVSVDDATVTDYVYSI